MFLHQDVAGRNRERRPHGEKSYSLFRCKDSNSHHAQEALRRAKFKFPGRQKIIVSRKWGFTKVNRADYIQWKSENRIVSDGVNAKLLGCHGPLVARQSGRAFLQAA
ncbi:hypothetical protein SAY87_018344 [Trapa incisa]|uniref:Ribosomal protein L10e/L16 domain-containing protein n=1 Tax=Trapa incisa TaxID=236973 RepID=A0AAN7QTP8_9MYRT|nr:hypothetical protein SAY87_018344 [Trapa incisa]